MFTQVSSRLLVAAAIILFGVTGSARAFNDPVAGRWVTRDPLPYSFALVESIKPNPLPHSEKAMIEWVDDEDLFGALDLSDLKQLGGHYEFELTSPIRACDPLGLCPPSAPCNIALGRSPNCGPSHSNCSVYLPWDPVQYGVCRLAGNAPGGWSNCVRGCLQRCSCSFPGWCRFGAAVFSWCHGACWGGCAGGGNPPY